MSTRLGRSGRLLDPVAQRTEAFRDAELAERIAKQAAEGPRGPRTRANENRRAAFARQRPVDAPEDAGEPPADAGEGEGRTRVRRGRTAQG